jgi:hypothetical protein
MPIRIDVFHHITFDAAPFDRIELSLSSILGKVNTLMATSAEVKDLALELKAKVESFGPAIDAAEARLTAAIAAGGVSQADLDDAFAALRGAADSADLLKADLEDGVDEAAPAP